MSEAQVQEDFQIWTNLSLSKEISDFDFSIEEEFRFFQNASSIEYFFTDFGVSYKLNKHFDFGINYRLKSNHVNINQYSNSHRFNFDTKYKFKFDRFDFYYRLRFQTEIESFNYVPIDDFYKNKLRNKVKVKYDINNSKLEPFGEIEVFANLFRINSLEIAKIRYTLGFGSEKNKFKGFKSFFRLENSLSSSINKRDYIIGISYSFDL